MVAGEYYIKVSSNVTDSYYSFIVSQTYDDAPDRAFYSNSFIQDITSSFSAQGTLQTSEDIDYYKVYLTQGVLKIITEKGDIQPSLYHNGITPTRENNATYAITTQGEYYIKVNASQAQDYSLSLELSPTNNSTIYFDDFNTSIKTISFKKVSHSQINDIQMFGRFVYAIDEKGDLIISDYSDTSNPLILSQTQLGESAKSLKIQGATAIAALGEDGIAIADITDKNNTSLIAHYSNDYYIYDIDFGQTNEDVNFSYATGKENGIFVLDMSKLNQIEQNTTINISATKINIIQDKAYVIENDNNISVYQISKNSFSFIGTQRVVGVLDFIVEDGYLYAITSSELKIFQILSSGALSPISSYTPQKLTSITDIGKILNSIYLVNDGAGYEIVDVSSLLSPSFSKFISGTVFDITGNAENVIMLVSENELNCIERMSDYPDTFKDSANLKFDTIQKGELTFTRRGERDIFKFNTDFSGGLNIEILENDHIKVSIYDASDDSLQDYLYEDNYQNIKWDKIKAIKSTNNSKGISNFTINASQYFLVIEGDDESVNGNYSFKATLDSTNDQFADKFDKAELSFSIGDTIKESLYGDGGDVDYVKFSVKNRGLLKFTSKKDFIPKMTIYHQDGEKIVEFVEENVSTTVLDKGDYVLKIEGYTSNDHGDYEIVTSYSPITNFTMPNGVEDANTSGIKDVKYLNGYIYALTNSTIDKYNIFLKKITSISFSYKDKYPNYQINNEKIFVYDHSKSVDIYATTNFTPASDGLQRVGDKITHFTIPYLSTSATSTTKDIAQDLSNIYFNEIAYIGSDLSLYLKRANAISITNAKNTQNFSNILIEGLGTVCFSKNYMFGATSFGAINIYQIDTANQYTLIGIIDNVSTDANEDIGAMIVDSKNKRLFVGADKEIKIFDITDIKNPVEISEFSLKNKNYADTPNSFYLNQDMLFATLKNNGILVLKISQNNQISLVKAILGLGEGIDNVYSFDNKSINYTTKDRTTNDLVLRVYFFGDSYIENESESLYSGAQRGSEPKEGCFIATAAYGSYFEKHVKVLRDFRDNILLKTEIGKELVNFYYTYSPPIAQKIAQNEFAKLIIRAILTPIVYLIKYPFLVIAGIFILALMRKKSLSFFR